MLPDINVLIAAHRADHPQHKVAPDWLGRNPHDGNDGQVLVLPMQVISGFLRWVTNSRIFPRPSTIAQAVDFVDWLFEDTHVRLLGQTLEWANFRGFVIAKQFKANQVSDARLAALSVSLGESFMTFDKGFRQLLPRSLLELLSAA